MFDERAEVWRSRMTSPPTNQYVVVAELDGSYVVGFACVYGADDERWGSLLDNLHVRTELHRSGIGRVLVNEVVRWCAERYPDHGLYLWVLGQNINGRAFYARIGGTDVGGEPREASAGGGLVNEVRRIAWPALPPAGLGSG